MGIWEFILAVLAVTVPIVTASQVWVHRFVNGRVRYLEDQLAECIKSRSSETNNPKD